MNRLMRKTALINSILLAVGIVCMIAGVCLGGRFTYTFNPKSHKLYVPTDEEVQYVDETLDLEAFDGMDVEVGNVDVEVRRGEAYQVQYHLSSLDNPVIEVQDKKLVIQNEEEELVTFGWSFNLFGMHMGAPSNVEQKKMIVTIPENVSLADVKVSSEFGDINMADLSAENAEIQADSGDVSLENMEIGTGTIVAEFGDVTVRNLTGEQCAITANSGDCSLDAMKWNQFSVAAAYGKVELNEIEAQECVIEAESGDVSLANITAGTGTIAAQYGDVVIDNMNGDSCSIVAESGTCELDTVHLVNLELTSEYGNVNLTGVEADTLAVVADSGNITCRDVVAVALALTSEYGNVSIEDCAIEDVDIVCESGDCDVALMGNAEEYDMDITVDSGTLKINGEEQGDRYKSISEKSKCIVIQSEYGDVELVIE